MMVEDVMLEILADVPLNWTVVPDVGKLPPVMVTVVPTGPWLGEKLVMNGFELDVTSK